MKSIQMAIPRQIGASHEVVIFSLRQRVFRPEQMVKVSQVGRQLLLCAQPLHLELVQMPIQVLGPFRASPVDDAPPKSPQNGCQAVVESAISRGLLVVVAPQVAEQLRVHRVQLPEAAFEDDVLAFFEELVLVQVRVVHEQ